MYLISRKNNIIVNGAREVSNNIGKLLNLTHLDLNFRENSLKVDGAKAVGENIGKLLNLTYLSLNLM